MLPPEPRCSSVSICNLPELVYELPTDALREQIEWHGETRDDAIAYVFRHRSDIADKLCSRYPVGPSRAIDTAVEDIVNLRGLIELAGELCDDSIPARQLPVAPVTEPDLGTQ